MRIDDAILLADSGRWSTAYYLSGYAVELGLKAAASKVFRPETIPDKRLVNTLYTHNFEELVSAAGLRLSLRESLKENTIFASYWGVASQWDESSRYKTWDAINASVLINAIADKEDGVLQWVSKHW